MNFCVILCKNYLIEENYYYYLFFAKVILSKENIYCSEKFSISLMHR